MDGHEGLCMSLTVKKWLFCHVLLGGLMEIGITSKTQGLMGF
jgi:hypothetical protein